MTLPFLSLPGPGCWAPTAGDDNCYAYVGDPCARGRVSIPQWEDHWDIIEIPLRYNNQPTWYDWYDLDIWCLYFFWFPSRHFQAQLMCTLRKWIFVDPNLLWVGKKGLKPQDFGRHQKSEIGPPNMRNSPTEGQHLEFNREEGGSQGLNEGRSGFRQNHPFNGEMHLSIKAWSVWVPSY